MTEERPTLRLRIESTDALGAAEVGTILIALQSAFSSYVEQIHQPNSRLRIDRAVVGSLLLDLVSIADAVVSLYDARQVLAGFTAQLGDALQALRGHLSLRVTPEDRSAVEALAAPVMAGSATQVSLQVIGDNNTVIIVTPEHAAELAERGILPVGVDPEAGRRPWFEVSEEEQGSEAGEQSYIAEAQPFGDEWYARIDGSNSWVPVTATRPVRTQLGAGGWFALRGRLIRSDAGVPRAFIVEAASRCEPRSG